MAKILITGGTGQIGLELARLSWPAEAEIYCPSKSELDLADPKSIFDNFERERWDAVINSAAYTAVDAAEDDVANAFLCNAQGSAWLAEVAHRSGSAFIQISTDYVFDGSSTIPYVEDDPVAPINAYGASKLAGELAVCSAHPQAVILRTAWVLSIHRTNFLKTMLRLGGQRSHLNVVADQYGCPTSAADIAAALQKIVLRQIEGDQVPSGIHHFVNSGSADWCQLARTIFEIGAKYGGPTPEITAIKTADYPTRARRPHNSRLSNARISKNFGIVPRPWEEAVADIIDQLHSDAGREASA